MITFKSEEEYLAKVRGFRRMQKLASILFWTGFWLWLAETLMFIILYSWHWEPANNVEKTLDIISGALMLFGIYFMIRVSFDVTRFFIESILPPQNSKQQYSHEQPSRHSDN